jgi:hypothetical protein
MNKIQQNNMKSGAATEVSDYFPSYSFSTTEMNADETI